MIYEVTHFIQAKLPFLWNGIEKINEWLFVLRYGNKLNTVVKEEQHGSYIYRRLNTEDVATLVEFFGRQPEESFRYFKPHEFDADTVSRLLRNKSYLAYGVMSGEQCVGYYFLRSYFIGKSYLGKLVDADLRGQGIGKQMCMHLMDVATALGLHMYETISKDNLSSLYATQKVLETKVIKELPNNYLYIEDLRKKPIRGGYKWLIDNCLWLNAYDLDRLSRRRGYSYAA